MLKFLIILSFLVNTAFAADNFTIVTSSGPGSLSDTTARYLEPLLQKELNTNVIVDNKPGALGLLGINYYMQKPKDGSSVFLGGTQIAYVSKYNKQELVEDPMSELEPLYGISQSHSQILVPINSFISSYKDLHTLYLKKGTLFGGISHPSHQISMRLLDQLNSATTTTVNYKQATQLATDLAAGIIDYTVAGPGTPADVLLQAGKLKAVGKLKDLKIDDFSWTAIFIHKATPEKEKLRVKKALEKIVRSSDIKGLPHELFLEDAVYITKQLNKEYYLMQ